MLRSENGANKHELSLTQIKEIRAADFGRTESLCLSMSRQLTTELTSAEASARAKH
jgi:hypothetical protein